MSEPILRLIEPSERSLSGGDRLLEAQRNVLEMIVRGDPLARVLTELCLIVETQASAKVRAAILLMDAAGRTLSTGAAPGLPEAYNRAVDGIAIDPKVGTCAAAAALRENVITRDIANDPAWRDLKHLPLALGLVAAWSVPIKSSTGKVLGTFGTYFAEVREPSSSERHLVEVLARTAALAIEREASDAKLRESEARYRAIVESTPECVKVIAPDGKLLQMNAAGLAMIQSGEANAIGASIYAVIAPEHRELFVTFNEGICRGETGSLKFDIVGADGMRRSMHSKSVPLVEPAGGYLHLAVTRDISVERALVQDRARLDYAVRLSGVGFWYCPLPFDALFWDERVKEHFFLPADAHVNITDFYDRIHPDDRESTRANIDLAIREHRSYDTVYRTVDPISGDIKWIRALGGAAYGPDGSPTHFDGVTVDVTAQKRDQERLALVLNRERAQARLLNEQDRRKDEFLATLAHELRNPLAPIRTGLQILRVGGNAEQSGKTHDMMERQLRHLVRMVDDLLDISRITLGKVTLRKERIDFRAVLHSATESTRSLIESANHEFAVRLPPDPLPLDVDPTRLTQVIANLLNNSAKYTPPGGRIQLTADIDGTQLILKVTDNGVGIPADMLPRVFEMFTQVGRSIDRSQGGLGIGLTLVRRLVEMHGGKIDAQSAGHGLGTTFTVALPLAPGSAALPDDGQEAPTSSAPRRILVVDDNVDAAASLAMLLELDGHTLRVADNGDDALIVAEEFVPDVVFLDIGLPTINGYEVARRLRANPQLPRNMRLIALTGWGTDEDRRRAQAAGFDQHLVKPVDPELLAALLTAQP
ncbi:MAG: ATP-binding protein [Pseudomonadota bacterium]